MQNITDIFHSLRISKEMLKVVFYNRIMPCKLARKLNKDITSLAKVFSAVLWIRKRIKIDGCGHGAK